VKPAPTRSLSLQQVMTPKAARNDKTETMMLKETQKINRLIGSLTDRLDQNDETMSRLELKNKGAEESLTLCK